MARIDLSKLETDVALSIKVFGEGNNIVSTAEADAAQLEAGQTVTVTMQPNVKVGQGGGKSFILSQAVFTLIGK
jgi:hypothetical protein